MWGSGWRSPHPGRTVADDENLFVLFCVVVAFGILGVSVVAGVTQPVDPRVIAAEPLSDRDRAIGLLASAASGPPGLSGALIGIGLAIGAARGATSMVIVVPTVLAWLATLLLLTRTATNALGLLSNRFPRTGQIIVGLSGLVFYGAFQVVPAVLGHLDRGDRDQIARVLSLNPVGQLGRALGAADESMGAAAGHLVLGALWLPILAAAFQSTTHALTVSTRRGAYSATALSTSPVASPSTVRRSCAERADRAAPEPSPGAASSPASARRAPRSRRSPGRVSVWPPSSCPPCSATRSAVARCSSAARSSSPCCSCQATASVPTVRRSPTSSSPAPARDLARGKARHRHRGRAPRRDRPVAGGRDHAGMAVPPGRVMVGVGALLAGSGGAIVQSTLVPVAIPESDNPFAGGETGRGMMAALLLGAVLLGLAVVTLPVALALLWANARGSLTLVTVFGAGTVAIGWAVMRGGISFSTRRLTGRGPEFISAITPSR